MGDLLKSGADDISPLTGEELVAQSVREVIVMGVNFVNLKDAGDPVEIGAAYDKAGADELVFLDITASSDARAIKTELVRKVAERVFIPFTVGGGIRTVEDFRDILR
ncbi:MAG: hypothetical protein IJV76_12740, partial [Clostridia bacterium]|nr:hypothetical protein [Clostridia bacterium]